MKTKTAKFVRTTLSLAVAGSLVLTGCANEQVAQHISYEGSERQNALTESSKIMSQAPVVLEHKGAWLLGESMDSANRLPSFMSKDVFFRESGDFTIYDLAGFVSTQINIKPQIDQSVFIPFGSSSATHAASKQPAAAGGMVGPAMNMGAATGGANSRLVVPTAKEMSYKGSLSGFLDYATMQMGVSWEYQNGAVVLFRTKTAVFEIPGIQLQSSMQSLLSSSGGQSGGGGMTGGAGGAMGGAGGAMGGAGGAMGGAGGAMGGAGGAMGGQSGQTGTGGGMTNMNTNVTVDYWVNIDKIAQSVAGYGAQISSDSSFGTITVTGTPNQIARVKTWVDHVKQSLMQRVALEVKIYNVQVVNEENYGFDPAKMLYTGSTRLGFSATPMATPATVGGVNPLNFGATVLSGINTGSNIAVQALSTLGRVSEVFSRSGVTINGQMLALQSANTQAYLASSGSTLAANVGATTTLTPGQVVTGFTGSFLPKVVDDQIYVDFNLTIANLVSMTNFTSGTGASATSIQLPQTVSTTFQQIASLKPGQSLVLTGYRDKSAHTINNGTVTPTNYSFGGGVDSTGSDNVIAVVITAKLI